MLQAEKVSKMRSHEYNENDKNGTQAIRKKFQKTGIQTSNTNLQTVRKVYHNASAQIESIELFKTEDIDKQNQEKTKKKKRMQKNKETLCLTRVLVMKLRKSKICKQAVKQWMR